MKTLFFCQSICVIYCIRSSIAVVDEDTRRYKIVSDYEMARAFYPRIKTTKGGRSSMYFEETKFSPVPSLYANFCNSEPHQNEPKLKWYHRRKICEDVMNSNYLGCRNGLYIYYGGKNDDNPIACIPVSPNYYKSEERIEECVFTCPVRKKGTKPTEIYISEAYQLGGNSPTTEVFGRFTFRRIGTKINLEGLAEPVANVLPQNREELEKLYAERRSEHDGESNFRKDPLCSVSFRDLIRICTSVFNSEYFEKLKFNYSIFSTNWVNGSCAHEEISFKTKHGLAAAAKKAHKEWLVSCRPGADEDASKEFIYYLSHAYVSNQIFVFKSVTDEGGKKRFFLQNLTINIRLRVKIE